VNGKSKYRMKFQFKEKLSIDYLGRFNFWIGISIGLLAIFVFKLLFSAGLESLRYLNFLAGKLSTYSNWEWFCNEFFMSLLATTLGMCLGILFWLLNISVQKRKENRRKILFAISFLSITLWFPLMAIGRMATTLYFVVYSSRSYDNELNFYDDFSLVYFIIPISIFLQSWLAVQLLFKCKKWMIYSFVGCLILGLLFINIRAIDPSILKDRFYNNFKEEITFSNSVLQDAEENYGINYSPETKEVIQSQRTLRSMQQVKDVKKAFESSRRISLDTILLNRIIIHNAKQDRLSYRKKMSWKNWVYSTPLEIYDQLKLHKFGTSEYIELINCLEELKLIQKFIRIKKNPNKKYSYWQRKKMRHSFSYDLNELERELEIVSGSLEQFQ